MSIKPLYCSIENVGKNIKAYNIEVIFQEQKTVYLENSNRRKRELNNILRFLRFRKKANFSEWNIDICKTVFFHVKAI